MNKKALDKLNYRDVIQNKINLMYDAIKNNAKEKTK